MALAGAACAALSIIQTRRLASSEHTAAIVFYFTCLTTAVGGGALLIGASRAREPAVAGLCRA